VRFGAALSCSGLAMASKSRSFDSLRQASGRSGFRVRTPALLTPAIMPARRQRSFAQKLRSGISRADSRSDKLRVTPQCRSKAEILRARARSGFRVRTPVRLAPHSRPQCRSKCNEALSRDLWPLDPFESAPMRATSSGMGYCILCAIQLLLEIKDLAELLSGKAGSNSLPLKKLLCGFC